MSRHASEGSWLFRVITVCAGLLLSILPSTSLATMPRIGPTTSSRELSVKFLEPKSGDTLSGMAPIRFEIGGNVRTLLIGVDDNPPSPINMSMIQFDTLQYANGAHALVARVQDRAGRVRKARVNVTFCNPSQRLLRIEPVTYRVSKGRLAIIDLVYSEPNLRVEPDFGAMDSNFDLAKVKVESRLNATYRVSYPISADSTSYPGRHPIKFRAFNAQGEAITNSVDLMLFEFPLLPIVVRECKCVSGAIPVLFVDRAEQGHHSYLWSEKLKDQAPTNVKLDAPADLLQGRPNRVIVSWSNPPATASAPLEGTRILIEATRYSTFYQCDLPKGETSAEIVLELPQPGTYGSNLLATEPIPDSLELRVAITARMMATGWATHRFTVSATGSTAEQRRLRELKIQDAARRKAAAAGK